MIEKTSINALETLGTFEYVNCSDNDSGDCGGGAAVGEKERKNKEFFVEQNGIEEGEEEEEWV